MFDKLKIFVTQGTMFYGLEVFQVDGVIEFRFLEVKRKKGELTITKNVHLNELMELKKHAKLSKPLYLVFNTSNVVTKLFESNVQMNDEAVVAQKFPGLNFENFYFQLVTYGDSSILSVVKKELLNKLLTRLTEMKLSVAGFSLGPGALHTLLPFIQNGRISTNTEELSLMQTKNGISEISKTVPKETSVYKINGLHVENTGLLSFAGILKFLSSPIPKNSNFGNVGQDYLSSFRSNRMFELLRGTFLAVVLLVLLGNFLVFSYYHSTVQKSTEHLAIDAENKKALAMLKRRVGEKETKVDAVLSSSTSRSSFYLDELGATVPGSIVLSEIVYQPFLKPVQEKKQIELHKNRVEVLGTCRAPEDFSQWIAKLEGLEWVVSVETMDYDYQSRNSSIFKLRINVSEL